MRRFSWLLALGALIMMTVPAQAADVKEYKLDNGLLVLLKENHNAPVINFNVVYRVGSKYERPGITGISHLLEHMMFKTTKNLPLGGFDKQLKSVGADNNAYTWVDQTVYHETIAADKIDVALGLEAERMHNLLCLPIDHELEMPVVRNELEQRDDSPFSLLYEELLAASFKAHPYHVPTIGWLSDVEGITADDIKAYYDAYYQPDNAFIVAVGDFNSDELFAKIKEHFGAIPAAGIVKPRLTVEPPQLGERRFEIRRAGQMDFLLIGWHVPESENPDNYALVVLGNILGSGRTSRLYHAMVESGQCAEAFASNSAFGYQDPFLFLAGAVLNPGTELDAVEQNLLTELERIKTDGVTADELARAKKQAVVSFVYEKDNVEQEATGILDFELMSSYQDADKYLPGIEAVTSADVMRVATQYLTRDNRTIGRYYAKRPEAEAALEGAAGEDMEGADVEGAEAEDAAPAASAGDAEQSKLTPPQYKPAAPQSAPVAAAADAESSEPYATERTLPNGLKVVVRENHNNQTVCMSATIPAGRITDPEGKPGVANFGVSMLANGTTEHSKLELSELLENAGIELGFTPSRETFGMGGRSLSEDFPLLAGLAAEMLLKPSFPADEIELTRQQIQAGLLNSKNDTFDMSFYTGRDLIYGAGHPFAGRAEGTPESVAAITRDDLVAWHDKMVVPEGSVLVVVGDVDTEAAFKIIEDQFGTWQGSQPGRAALIARGAEFKTDAPQRTDINLPEKSNAALLWIGPGMGKATDDWAARQIATFTFGGDFYSRMNERLRIKEGLTYGAFAWLSNGLAAGPFCVSVQVNPENIEPGIKATEEELARFAKDGITDEELALAKNYLSGNYPVKLMDNASVAAAISEAVYLGFGLDYIQRYQADITAVDKAQVDAVAAKLADPANFKLVVAGTLKQ
jgi:zinc protease